MSQDPAVAELSSEARAVRARLETLWADEGVDQLAIFLDPDIITVLKEIKQLSFEFVDKVASFAD